MQKHVHELFKKSDIFQPFNDSQNLNSQVKNKNRRTFALHASNPISYHGKAINSINLFAKSRANIEGEARGR